MEPRSYEDYLREIQELKNSPDNDGFAERTLPNEGPDIDKSRFQFAPGFLDGFARKVNGLFKN